MQHSRNCDNILISDVASETHIFVKHKLFLHAKKWKRKKKSKTNAIYVSHKTQSHKKSHLCRLEAYGKHIVLFVQLFRIGIHIYLRPTIGDILQMYESTVTQLYEK